MLYGMVFGLKLHIVINDKGEILDFLFTPANVDDRKPRQTCWRQGLYLKNIV